MDFTRTGPRIPQGLCGVYLLQIIDVDYFRDKDGNLIRKNGKRGYLVNFKTMPYGDYEGGQLIDDSFWLGENAWRLDKFFKALGVKRKQDLNFRDFIGQEVFCAIGIRQTIDQDGVLIEERTVMVEYTLVGPGKHKPCYVGDPDLNDGVPQDNSVFLKTEMVEEFPMKFVSEEQTETEEDGF